MIDHSEYSLLDSDFPPSSHDRVGSAGSVVAREVYWVPPGQIPGLLIFKGEFEYFSSFSLFSSFFSDIKCNYANNKKIY